MLAYIQRLGYGLDVFMNVCLFDGATGETISLHSAKAEAGRRVWGCVLCRYLSITVETNHCAKTLAGTTTSPAGAIMAGVQLFGFAGFLLMIWAMFF